MSEAVRAEIDQIIDTKLVALTDWLRGALFGSAQSGDVDGLEHVLVAENADKRL